MLNSPNMEELCESHKSLVKLVDFQDSGIKISVVINLATLFNNLYLITEYSSVWSECLVWDQDATGSNPVIPI